MTDNKFTIGSQWKTRRGSRAVVVGFDTELGGRLLVYHENKDKSSWRSDGKILSHKLNGRHHLSDDNDSMKNSDLISPWTEPRKGTFWVNVMDVEDEIYPKYVPFCSKENAVLGQKSCEEISSKKCLARIEVNWVEGQGLEDEK